MACDAARRWPPPPAPAPRRCGSGDDEDDVRRSAEDDLDDDDDLENALSLAAMEAELKPQGAGDLRPDRRRNYKKLRKLQDQLSSRKLQDDELCAGQEKRYKKLKDEIVTDVKSLSLNTNRIEALVEQLYDINKRLIGFEGRLLRLAESYGVKRDDFLKRISGHRTRPELAPPRRPLEAQGWKDFVDDERDTVKDIRARNPEPRRRDRARRSPNSAASCTSCRRASAKRARRRRKWSRPICAS